MDNQDAFDARCTSCASNGSLDFRFTFAFQPIVDVRAQTIYSYEALVRGLGGEPAAWVLGQLNDTNRYRFDQSCRVGAIALAARLGVPCNININFMPNAVYRPEHCIRTTFAAAEKYQFPIERIVFEVVENDKLDEASRLVEIMREYKRFGFLTAIDDFGAGFAELKMLAAFQPDVLKIDMDVIRGVDHDPARQAIIRGLIVTCDDLGIRLLAEGVETWAEYGWLREAGIDLYQGFLLARPGFESLPEVDFDALRAFDAERRGELAPTV